MINNSPGMIHARNEIISGETDQSVYSPKSHIFAENVAVIITFEKLERADPLFREGAGFGG